MSHELSRIKCTVNLMFTVSSEIKLLNAIETVSVCGSKDLDTSLLHNCICLKRMERQKERSKYFNVCSLWFNREEESQRQIHYIWRRIGLQCDHRLSDSGTYICAVDRLLKDTYKYVTLHVFEGVIYWIYFTSYLIVL